MSLYQISCPGRVLFREDELASLARLEGGFELSRRLYCALETGHEGVHCVIAQGVSGTEEIPPWNMWIRWPEGDEYGPGREMLRLEDCPANFLTGTVQEEGCHLPMGHWGRHGYEFGPPLTDSDVMPEWLFRRFG
ncbi:hypothetical protein [Streptomyces sp. CAU 1734]|uniref:hypothetical protein n=1 Tax=Streptomyces sp. CAU 1734 TaxID=3140360 RepID=UPI003260C243